MPRRYNLIHEKWIPIEGAGKASLKEVFSCGFKGRIGGNPIQKISLYKLLLAIAQDAILIENEAKLRSLGIEEFGVLCRDYLEKYEDCFWLYGDKPFLQYPELEERDIKINPIFCRYIPDLSADNDTIIRETQTDPPVDDGEKALFVLTLMSYALGGKRVADPKTFLYDVGTRSKSAKAAPSLGGGVSAGYQQSLFLCDSILETVYCNSFTQEEIVSTKYLVEGILPPWRKRPSLEDSQYNEQYKRSVYAWYLAMSRAVLLIGDGIKYCEGLSYVGDWFEPFVSGKENGGFLIVDPRRRTWRMLPSLLSGVYAQKDDGKGCYALKVHLNRVRRYCRQFEIWSGGLKVRGNSGDQSIKGNDDFVESSVSFYDGDLLGDESFARLCDLAKEVDTLEVSLKKSVDSYYKFLGLSGNGRGDIACIQYLQILDSIGQSIVDSSVSIDSASGMKKIMFHSLLDVYDNHCMRETSRQILAWAKFRLRQFDKGKAR